MLIRDIGGPVSYEPWKLSSLFSPISHRVQEHAFPKASLVFRNSAQPGVDSSFTILCMDARVDPDVDILLVSLILKKLTVRLIYDLVVSSSLEVTSSWRVASMEVTSANFSRSMKSFEIASLMQVGEASKLANTLMPSKHTLYTAMVLKGV